MTIEEAIAWLRGERSLANSIPAEPHETWLVRIAEADAAMTQQAYWIAKAHTENLIPSLQKTENDSKKKLGEFCQSLLKQEQTFQ